MIEKAKKMIKDDAENEKGIINHQLQNIFLYEKDSYDTAEKIIDLIVSMQLIEVFYSG